MLTERQKAALNMLIERYTKAALLTASQIAGELGVTTKTVRADIKALNEELDLLDAHVTTISGKGYRLEVRDEASLASCMELLAENEVSGGTLFDDRDERVRFILGMLLFARKPVLSDMLAYEVFVSRSQFSLDIREAKRIADNYGLKVLAKSRQGMSIEGAETDKRACLIQENINYKRHLAQGIAPLNATIVGKQVADALIAAQREIADRDFQNLLLYIEVAATRIRSGFMLHDIEKSDERLRGEVEWGIAEQIWKSVAMVADVRVNEAEIAHLASTVRGMRLVNDYDAITDEVSSAVAHALRDVRSSCGFDFTNDLELRMNLSLHMVAMLSRARGHQLAANPLISYIKQSMPLAYDMASVARRTVEERCDVQLNEDESGYLAVYFATALNAFVAAPKAKRVLVITSSRRSEELLLRYAILHRFSSLINVLEICQVSELKNVDSAAFDVVFSTIQDGRSRELPFEAIPISYFPSMADFAAMEVALASSNNTRALRDFFSEELFFVNPPVADRTEAIEYLARAMVETEGYDFDLSALVLAREELATTLFAGGVALPHPVEPTDSPTIASVAIFDRPIPWGDGSADIVFLLNIQKDAEVEMQQLYDLFASLMQSNATLRRLHATPAFATFMDIVSDLVATA